ncbi:DUF4240 domain-containing protein [Dactylosporangium sp. NPDC051485]|uniref:DUF4240 domain-containing protein n=1 Tax=Dactylosporangium sp. NPDC051485 TaxID=3154846 RepID=UPI0034272836
MNADEFWMILEASAHDGATPDRRLEILRQRLSRAPRRHLLDWAQLLDATRKPADTARLWRAADIIMPGHSGTDGFHDFQMWLVGLGRAAYEAAVADPDTLAAVPAVRRLAAIPYADRTDADLPMWQELEGVAVEIGFDRPDLDGDVRDILFEERAVLVRSGPNPDDLAWFRLKSTDLSRYYPRLWALFGSQWRD